MVNREQETCIKHEDYEIGALMGKSLRNRLFHSSTHFIELRAVVTLGVFGIMMKYFSEIESPPVEVPGRLKINNGHALALDNMTFEQLQNFLNELEEKSRIRGWKGNIFRVLEECGLREEQRTLQTVFDILSEMETYPKGNITDVYVSVAIQFMLSIGEMTGTGLASAAVMPLEIMQLLKQMTDIKDEHVCYGATGESVVLLPFLALGKENEVIISYNGRNYEAAIVMIQIMSWQGGKSKFVNFIQSCIPDNVPEIIGKCDRSFAFPPFYRQMLLDIPGNFDSNKLEACIAWWPEYQNSGQWIYARHIVSSLNEEGIGYVFMPLRILSRMGGIEEVRDRFIKENLLDAVIEFPGGTFMRSNVSVALLVLKKNRKVSDVQMINLAGKEGKKYITIDTRLHRIDFRGLNEIEKVIRNRTKVKGLSDIIACERIAQNACCFSPSAYVFDEMKVDVESFTDIAEEMEYLQSELIQISSNYDDAIEKFCKVKEQWKNSKQSRRGEIV